jgi:hypothetical protein
VAMKQAIKQPGKWFQIRHDLYRHVQARVQQRLGPESRELKAYREAFEKDFKKKWSPSSLKELLKRVNQSDLVFLSDFHALKQSQRTHLRILKKVRPSGPIILAMECIEARYQKQIDLFVQKKISEKEFLKRIKWNEQWGFPWENYKPLFEWAQYHKVKIVGLNYLSDTKSRMKNRDVFAAQKISDILVESPEAKVLVIYGDLHLASAHLPKLAPKRVAGREIKSLRVFQNSEKIYFEMLKAKNGEEVEVVKLDNSTFCVLNVPPWVKWQNYLMFLEETYDQELDESIDFTDHVMAFAKLLCKEFNFKISLSDLSVYSAGDRNFWELIEDSCNKSESEFIAHMIDEEMYFYLPENQVGYISRASVNQAASLAMEYLVFKISKTKHNFLSAPDDFIRWIWLNGWSYFGGKIVNPKRKTDTLLDIKSKLTSKKGHPDREPLQLALSQKVLELMNASQNSIAKLKFKPKRKTSYLMAAELLGGLMGERIYSSYISGKLSAKEIQNYLEISLEDPDFEAKYLSFVKLMEKTPLSFKSKEEKI